MGLGKFWRDEAKREALIGLFGIGMALFGKGNRATIIIRILDAIPGKVEAFGSARAKIDAADAMIENGEVPGVFQLALSNDEISALDDFLDLTRRPKRELKRILRGGF